MAIQDRTYELRNVALNAVIDLIYDVGAAKKAGATDDQLITARQFQRKAQFYLDFVESEYSMGFHAPQKAARVLGKSIDFARQGQVALRDRKP